MDRTARSTGSGRWRVNKESLLIGSISAATWLTSALTAARHPGLKLHIDHPGVPAAVVVGLEPLMLLLPIWVRRRPWPNNPMFAVKLSGAPSY